MKTANKEGPTLVRCQYCGKNLWPLRGLFDEDFCSKDHRQRYHERVRKAMEHLPKGQGTPRATGIAGFQFQKPRTQEPSMAAAHRAAEPSRAPSSPAVPAFAHASASPSLGASSFSIAAPKPASGTPYIRGAAAPAFAPNVLSISRLREQFERSQEAAVAVADAPAAIAPRARDVAPKASRRWSLSPEAFDELNHVYLRVPDPVLEACLPVSEGLVDECKPIATVAKARHTATAGPSGAGRLEFFPMQPRTHASLVSGNAGDLMPERVLQPGDNVWLEDFVSWKIPVALAPERSSLAMLPATDRALALDRFREASEARPSAVRPLAWRFETASLNRRSEHNTGMATAPAMVIEFPAARDGAGAPLSDETAIFDAAAFALQIPMLACEIGELEMLTDATADVAPAGTDAFGPRTKIGETLLPRGASWVPVEAQSVLPGTPDLHGALAEPRIGADLAPVSLPSQTRNGARSVNPGVLINMPARAVRLKHGPEFFAAEPVMADSVARPVTGKPYAAPAPLAIPEMPASASRDQLDTASSAALVAASPMAGEATMADCAPAIETAEIQLPEIQLPVAAFGMSELKNVQARLVDTGDRLPHPMGWIEPELALAIPQMEYEEYPLALKVSVPEPRTVTVFETAKFDQPSKVLPINEARSRRYAVPSYIKGMAAGLMLASFLWFGSSSIKSGGMTMRPGDLIRLTIQRRAVYEVGDNFHAGLTGWDGKGLVKTWVYDKEGFIRPGRLAIYKPSRDMKDYKLEFLTQIERRGVNWVVRAADEQNYYGMKLAVTEPGPRPLVALMRYTVIDGKKEARGETPLQVMMHNNRPYRVEVDVKGNHFLTSIEGQLVDSWSDDQLKSGGVGFFTEGNEKARLYWMKVTKNSDFLGKLCSILVPKES